MCNNANSSDCIGKNPALCITDPARSKLTGMPPHACQRHACQNAAGDRVQERGEAAGGTGIFLPAPAPHRCPHDLPGPFSWPGARSARSLHDSLCWHIFCSNLDRCCEQRSLAATLQHALRLPAVCSTPLSTLIVPEGSSSPAQASGACQSQSLRALTCWVGSNSVGTVERARPRLSSHAHPTRRRCARKWRIAAPAGRCVRRRPCQAPCGGSLAHWPQPNATTRQQDVGWAAPQPGGGVLCRHAHICRPPSAVAAKPCATPDAGSGTGCSTTHPIQPSLAY